MTHIVHLQNDKGYTLDPSALERAARATLGAHDMGDGELTIVVTDDAEVQQMNRDYRGIDKPTDVLSFPFDDDGLPEDIDDEAEYLGDVVIAYPYTVAHAIRDGYSSDDSLSLMVVHGTLHLLGYDHDTPEERAEMWQVQADILRTLGINPDIVAVSENE